MNLQAAVLLLPVVAVLAVHRFVLSNRSQVWLGAIVPAAWLVAMAFFAADGKLDGFRDWAMVTVGFLLLLGNWDRGQTARKEKLKKEDERIDAVNAARSGVQNDVL